MPGWMVAWLHVSHVRACEIRHQGVDKQVLDNQATRSKGGWLPGGEWLSLFLPYSPLYMCVTLVEDCHQLSHGLFEVRIHACQFVKVGLAKLEQLRSGVAKG